MKETIVLTGMVISATPVGDYDKRLVILTKEYGRIIAFANGCRRATSPLLAIAKPFTCAKFHVYPGKNAYVLTKADVFEYFDAIVKDLEAVTYGMYFMELADYFVQENEESRQTLMLLFSSCKALLKETIEKKVIRLAFEVRLMMINGIGPYPAEDEVSKRVQYSLQYMRETPINQLFAFALSKDLYDEVTHYFEKHKKKYLDHDFKSLHMLDGPT